MPMRSITFLLLAAVAPAWAWSQDAPVDSAQTGPLEEVTVTATRHEESMSKVPISISAFTEESIDTKGIRDFNDVARFTPGVMIDANRTNAISIRGISSSGGAGTTGIYIDDTPIQMRALGFNPDDTLPKAFDLERIEVLRGPQGTLFGAGSEGGTVRYILPQPNLTQDTLYARTEASYTQGGAPSYEAGVAGGTPIIRDTLAFRASAWYRRDGGWIDRANPITGAIEDSNANRDDTLVLRLAALWALSDALRITPSVIYQDRERHDVSIYWPSLSDPGSHRFINGNPTARSEPDKYVLPALKIDAQLGGIRLISNTSYFHRSDVSGYDGTLYNLYYYQSLRGVDANGDETLPGTYPLLDSTGVHLPPGLESYRSPASVDNVQDNVTEEIRLQSEDPNARVIWTVGAFWSINREFSLEQIHDPMADALFSALFGMPIAEYYGTDQNPDGSSVLPMGDSYFNRLVGHDRQLAAFGEATWSITDQWKLTLGARYSRTDFSFISDSEGPQNGGSRHGSGEQHDRPFTPKIGVSYQMDRDNLFYATYAKGFRVGGANPPIPGHVPQEPGDICYDDAQAFEIDQFPTAYKPDTVQSYEIGSKNNFDNRLRLATSLYYIRWNQIQQTVLLPTCGLTYTDNLGTAVAKGFDVQADIAITSALTLETAAGYTSARYTSDSLPSSTSPPGTTPIVAKGDAISGQAGGDTGIAGAPWTVSAGLQYAFTAFGHESFARLDYQYQAKARWPTAAQDPNTSQYDPFMYTPAATSFVSARLGSSFGRWNAAAFIDNLFDTHTTFDYSHTVVDSGAPFTMLPLYRNYTFRPRTLGMTLTYRY